MFPLIVFRPGAVFYKVTGGSQCRAGGGGQDSGAAACWWELGRQWDGSDMALWEQPLPHHHRQVRPVPGIQLPRESAGKYVLLLLPLFLTLLLQPLQLLLYLHSHGIFRFNMSDRGTRLWCFCIQCCDPANKHVVICVFRRRKAVMRRMMKMMRRSHPSVLKLLARTPLKKVTGKDGVKAKFTKTFKCFAVCSNALMFCFSSVLSRKQWGRSLNLAPTLISQIPRGEQLHILLQKLLWWYVGLHYIIF